MWALTVRTWARVTPCWRQARPLGVEVEEQGLKTVEGGGEAGFGGVPGFELFPEGTQVASLTRREETV